MSDLVEYEIIGLSELFGVAKLEVYQSIDGISAIFEKLNSEIYNIHLISNYVDSKELYSLSRRRWSEIPAELNLLIAGRIRSLEIGYFFDADNWDFVRMKISDDMGNIIDVYREFGGFPEPVLRSIVSLD